MHEKGDTMIGDINDIRLHLRAFTDAAKENKRIAVNESHSAVNRYAAMLRYDKYMLRARDYAEMIREMYGFTSDRNREKMSTFRRLESPLSTLALAVEHRHNKS